MSGQVYTASPEMCSSPCPCLHLPACFLISQGKLPQQPRMLAALVVVLQPRLLGKACYFRSGHASDKSSQKTGLEPCFESSAGEEGVERPKDLGRWTGDLVASPVLFPLTHTAGKPLAALSRPARLCQREEASPEAFFEAFVVC